MVCNFEEFGAAVDATIDACGGSLPSIAIQKRWLRYKNVLAKEGAFIMLSETMAVSFSGKLPPMNPLAPMMLH